MHREVAASASGGSRDEAENRAVGICGNHCRSLLGTSELGNSNIIATYFVESCSIDLSDCKCWLPFSLRYQMVLGTSCELARVYANRSDGRRAAAIAESAASARTLVIAKSPLNEQPAR
jgi:hypothetical protein